MVLGWLRLWFIVVSGSVQEAFSRLVPDLDQIMFSLCLGLVQAWISFVPGLVLFGFRLVQCRFDFTLPYHTLCTCEPRADGQPAPLPLPPLSLLTVLGSCGGCPPTHGGASGVGTVEGAACLAGHLGPGQAGTLQANLGGAHLYLLLTRALATDGPKLEGRRVGFTMGGGWRRPWG